MCHYYRDKSRYPMYNHQHRNNAYYPLLKWGDMREHDKTLPPWLQDEI